MVSDVTLSGITGALRRLGLFGIAGILRRRRTTDVGPFDQDAQGAGGIKLDTANHQPRVYGSFQQPCR